MLRLFFLTFRLYKEPKSGNVCHEVVVTKTSQTVYLLEQ